MFVNTALLAALLAVSQEIPAGPRTGRFSDEYKDPKTKALIMRYVMAAPEKLPAQRHLGLIVQFHGMRGNETNLQNGVVESLQRLKLTGQYVVMGGKARGEGWTAGDDDFLLKWIAWAKETYPIDPRRVFLVGISNGGWMVKRFGWAHQDLFAGVAPYCGGGNRFENPSGAQPKLPKPGVPGGPADTRTEWYLVHGDADKEVNVESSRSSCADLKQRGYRYVYRELATKEHNNIWPVAEVRDDVFAWMHALRHKEIAVSADEKKALVGFGGKVETASFDEVSRIGGSPGGRILGKAFDKGAEVKLPAAATCEMTLYGREVVLELVKLLQDKSEEVKAAAFTGLSVAANWRYEEAQGALGRLASSKSKPVADRASAIKALARAVRLAILGNFEDKHLFWTLVLLLDDDAQEVRSAAFEALEKAVQGGFEYKPDLPSTERKTAVGKWKSWCTQKCGPQG